MQHYFLAACVTCAFTTASLASQQDEAIAKIDGLRKQLSALKALEAEWDVLSVGKNDAKSDAPAKPKSIGKHHIWMLGSKIREEFALSSISEDGVAKVQSKLVTVYEPGKIVSLRLPEKALTRNSGVSAGRGLNNFPPLNYFQLFTHEQNKMYPGYVVTLESFAQGGPIEQGIKSASLKRPNGNLGVDVDWASEPFPSLAPNPPPGLMVGYGIKLHESGWASRVAYFSYNEGKSTGSMADIYGNFKQFDGCFFPTTITTQTVDEALSPTSMVVSISKVVLNPEIDDEKFFIDPSLAEYVYDQTEKKVIAGGQETPVPDK